MKRKKEYLGNCEHMQPNDLEEFKRMVEGSHAIKYETLRSYVGARNLAKVFPDYQWGRGSGKLLERLTMKDDRDVTYRKSSYYGKECAFVCHSGIEYMFI